MQSCVISRELYAQVGPQIRPSRLEHAWCLCHPHLPSTRPTNRIGSTLDTRAKQSTISVSETCHDRLDLVVALQCMRRSRRSAVCEPVTEQVTSICISNISLLTFTHLRILTRSCSLCTLLNARIAPSLIVETRSRHKVKSIPSLFTAPVTFVNQPVLHSVRLESR